VLSFRKRLLGISTHTWEDNVMGGMERTDLTHHKNSWQALVNAVMNLRVPQNVGNFLTIGWKECKQP